MRISITLTMVSVFCLAGLAWAEDAQAEEGKPVAKKAGPLKIQNEQIVLPEPIPFKTAKDAVLAQSQWVLDSVAATVEVNPDICKLEIGVHSDSRGSSGFNKKLTQMRADAVRSHLIKKGVPRAMLTAVGYGEERPIASNRTAEGRSKNRRVEIVIKERCKK